jgi:hypothetical protein
VEGRWYNYAHAKKINMNKEQQEYFKNARDRFTTEIDSFLIAYDNAVNENAALQKEVERLKWR